MWNRWVAGEEGSESGADDDQDLSGMPEGKNVSTLEDEAPDDARKNDDRTDDLNHSGESCGYGRTVHRAGLPLSAYVHCTFSLIGAANRPENVT